MQAWVDIREPQTGKLLFRLDPERLLIEIGKRGKTTVVDLTQYLRRSRDAEESKG